MLTCVFTFDDEILRQREGHAGGACPGAGRATGRPLPRRGKALRAVPEVAEKEVITEARTDPDAGRVAPQVRTLHLGGFEVGLHFHPWWHQARHDGRDWVLDYSQDNLETLPPATIADRVDLRVLGCLRGLVGDQQFTPLVIPGGTSADAARGPGRRRPHVAGNRHRFCRSSKAGSGGNTLRTTVRRSKLPPTWRFDEDPSIADPAGRMLEVPVHAEMVATWRMLTGKRLSLERRSAGVSRSAKRVLD